MQRNNPLLPFANPLAQWSDLALKTTEMLAASAEVISHRTGRMASCGPLPSSEDQREFTLMGQEKIEAATEAAAAMTSHALDTQQRLWKSAMRHMLYGSSAMLSLVSSRSPKEAAENQVRLVRALARSAIATTKLSGAPASFAHRGLDPIHARATANALRLGRKK